MPRKCDWIHRLPQIRAEFEELSTPIIDRSMFEGAFRVGRRRAIQLMHRFGGYQSGRTFWIDRTSLLQGLDKIEALADTGYERRRKERLGDELEKIRRFAKATQVSVPVTAEIYGTRLNSLPKGVLLAPGQLTVAFSSPQELLERLFALAQALANDFDIL